jgi:rhodanese-related sulfurtransferase
MWRTGLLLFVCGLLACCQAAPEQAGGVPAVTVLPAEPIQAGPDPYPGTTPAAVAEPLVPPPAEGSRYRNIVPAQLHEMLQSKDFLLVNTHAPYGVEIAQTDAHIPIDSDGRWLATYPTDKSAKIVLYCRSGQWSSRAARELVKAGYTQVWHLDGGMVAWHAAGLPLVVP